jgi:hypothetical protein
MAKSQNTGRPKALWQAASPGAQRERVGPATHCRVSAGYPRSHHKPRKAFGNVAVAALLCRQAAGTMVDVAIIGGGAVGTYLCLRLRAAGLSVALKHREGRLPTADVLALLQPAGVSLVATWDAMPYAESIFVTTKTFDHEQVYAGVRTLPQPPKYLVAVHNGVMPEPTSLPATTTLIR